LLSRYDGILAGISSGAAIAACIKLKDKYELSGKTVVAVLPDTGERYLSTDLFRSDEVSGRIMYYEDWRAKYE
jgi:cysteine synthase A